MPLKHLSSNNIEYRENFANWDQLASDALCRLANSLISPSSIDEIASLVLEHGKKLTGSKFGFVGYIDPVSEYLVSPTLSEEVWKNYQFLNKEHILKKYKGLWGWVLKNKKPLLTNSPALDPRTTGTQKGYIPIHRFISAPAIIGEDLVGIICLANSERDYDQKDLNLIIQMARLYALAIDRKRTVEELYETKCRLEARVAEQTSKLREINLKLNLELEEKKRTEKNLEKAIRRNKLILESVGEGIYGVDRNGIITFANPATVAITGYNIDEIIGKKQHDTFHHTKPDGRPFPINECPVHMTLQDGKTRIIDSDVCWKKDGTSIPIEYTCTAIFEEDEIVGAVIAIKDISERLKSQKALEESEKLYRSLVHQSSDGIFILDPVTLKIKEANNQLLSMLGYSYKDLSHLYLKDIVNDDLKTIRDNIGKVISKGQYKLGPHNYIHRDGSLIPVEVSSSVIRLVNTQILMVNVRDIRERIRAEAIMAKSIKNLRAMLNKTVNALAIVTEIRDPYTAGHQQRVAHLACAIAQEMNLSKKQLEGINIAGILHDIGKIFVPSEILSKPGKLTELEMQLIKTHPLVGKEIVEPIPFVLPVGQIIAQHHEKLDGSGYPYGLAGSQISIEARILAVADVVEAIASHRPYRPALGIETALDEIQRHRGTFYDSDAVDACLNLFQNKGFRFNPSPMDKSFENLTGL